jgi:hypothetical protein
MRDERLQSLIDLSEQNADGLATEAELENARRRVNSIRSPFISESVFLAAKAAGDNYVQDARRILRDIRYNARSSAFRAAHAASTAVGESGHVTSAPEDAQQAVVRYIFGDAHVTSKLEDAQQASIVRDIFGDAVGVLPPVDGVLRTSCILALANGAYCDRNDEDGKIQSNRLRILADALEESGCSQESVLLHLRNNQDHWRGCWALDVVLGKT